MKAFKYLLYGSTHFGKANDTEIQKKKPIIAN